MALNKKDLDALLKKEYGITLPEFQHEEKMVSMQEFGIGIQNEIVKASLSSDEEKAKINKRAESYIARAAVIMKLAGEAAEGTEMAVPQLPIFAEAQVEKAIVADGQPAQLTLADADRDVFKNLLEGLGKLGEILKESTPADDKGGKGDDDKGGDDKGGDNIEKNAEPYSWAADMALELKTDDDKAKVEKKDDKKPEKKKVEKKERSLKTEEEIQKAADDKKTEIQKAADKEIADAKEKKKE